MKKIILSILMTLLFIIPLGVLAEEDEDEIVDIFNLKEQVINDFKSSEYYVNDTHISKDGNEVFTLVNELDNTLVLKVNDNSISNEDTKEMLLDVLANSTQVDGSLSFVCSNDLSYFVFSDDEERVYRISNLNTNNEIKISLIKNEQYINPEFNVNFDDYTITNGDAYIPPTNNNDNSITNILDKEYIDDQIKDIVNSVTTSEDNKESIVIKDSSGKELFSISQNEDKLIINVDDTNNYTDEEIEELVNVVADSYGVSKDQVSILQNNNLTNNDSTIIPIVEAIALIVVIAVLGTVIIKSTFKKKTKQ